MNCCLPLRTWVVADEAVCLPMEPRLGLLPNLERFVGWSEWFSAQPVQSEGWSIAWPFELHGYCSRLTLTVELLPYPKVLTYDEKLQLG